MSHHPNSHLGEVHLGHRDTQKWTEPVSSFQTTLYPTMPLLWITGFTVEIHFCLVFGSWWGHDHFLVEVEFLCLHSQYQFGVPQLVWGLLDIHNVKSHGNHVSSDFWFNTWRTWDANRPSGWPDLDKTSGQELCCPHLCSSSIFNVGLSSYSH